MKVVILAGGLGTRISEESHLKPKPMIEIGGRPILWHIMKYYAEFGFHDFIICLGYKQYVVKEFFHSDCQADCGVVCPFILCGVYADCLFCVWLCTIRLSAATALLYVLHVYVCAGAQLFDLCNRDFFQGFDADYQYHAASGHVGNPDFVEYLHAGSESCFAENFEN